MHPRIPALVAPLLDDYTTQVQQQLPGFLVGFYLGGSIALGGFNPRRSDIDFVALCQQRPTAHELSVLDHIHRDLRATYPRWSLSGSYLLAADLGRTEDQVPLHPFYHDGVLHAQGHFEINEVTWWVFKHAGIALLGPEPDTFDVPVNWEQLIRNMQINLNTYWASWLKRPDGLIGLWYDWGVEWTVTGVMRQFYTGRIRKPAIADMG